MIYTKQEITGSEIMYKGFCIVILESGSNFNTTYSTYYFNTDFSKKINKMWYWSHRKYDVVSESKQKIDKLFVSFSKEQQKALKKYKLEDLIKQKEEVYKIIEKQNKDEINECKKTCAKERKEKEKLQKFEDEKFNNEQWFIDITKMNADEKLKNYKGFTVEFTPVHKWETSPLGRWMPSRTLCGDDRSFKKDVKETYKRNTYKITNTLLSNLVAQGELPDVSYNEKVKFIKNIIDKEIEKFRCLLKQ